MTGLLHAGTLAPLDLIERHPNSKVWEPDLQHHQVVFVSSLAQNGFDVLATLVFPLALPSSLEPLQYGMPH